jgi:acyl transferase domain-containing protein
VPTALEPWPRERPLLAGVSSFGCGGTNGYVVLEGHEDPAPADWSALDLPVADAARPKVAFVCSPHGHQWFGMARSTLRTEPVFRAAMERCDTELRKYTGWSLLRELHVDEDRTRWDDVSVAQPVLFAVEVALAEWLEAGGSPAGRGDALRPGHEPGDAGLFTLSARSSAALREIAVRTADQLTSGPLAETALADVCLAAAHRSHHPHRLALVARSTADLAAKLRSAGPAPGGIDGRSGVAFVFPGQDSQRIGMGTELPPRESEFHAAIRECDAVARAYLDWSILAELRADESDSRMDRIGVIQPVVFAVQVALAELRCSWEVTPTAVVGHSMGETVAAHVAGALSPDDALRVICLRSKLMRRASGQGAMLAAELTMDQAERVTQPYRDSVPIAVASRRRALDRPVR